MEMEFAAKARKRCGEIRGEGVETAKIEVEDATVPGECHGDGWLECPQAVEIEIVGMSREADRYGKIEGAELVEGELATVAGEREGRCR
jgi:hypothetical protein